nr:energy-coupling factor transporter transmembrane component T [Candidatus Sigynarchaeum springense]MDO8118907.1 energy-coupling factor transporter transmembrane component T [Candidatus Sigynarchaeota archaeon]
MSIDLLKGFEFKKKDTFVHRLDPRSKLVITIAYSVLALSFSNIFPLAFFIATLLPFLAGGRIVKRWLTSLKGLSFIIIFIIVLNTLLTTLNFAISMCLRIILLVSSFSIFFMTVHPDELALSLLAMKVPFSFTFTLSLATRFVPTLAAEAQNIIDAQRSRGLELEKGNLLVRVKNMVPILIPLIINSIKRAFSIAEALESKAFGAIKTRTNYYEIKMRARDYTVIAIIILFVIGFFILYFGNYLPPVFYFTLQVIFPNL